MARFSAQGVALLVLVTFIANSNGLWYDCGTTLSQRLVRFNTFTAYPSPAIPGQELHFRATYQAYTELDDSARVEMNIMYGDNGDQASVLHVTDIPLCNFTSAVSCPVAVTPNYTQAISFDYLVPALADGNYMVNFKISLPARARALACLAFNVSIYNPSATQNGVFTSSYEAQLEAQAVFSSDSFLSRNVGSYIQIGPIGPLGVSPSWGTFDYISGTADVVHPSFDATNYVWGLSGILNTTSVTSDNFPSHIYYGQFWIGYSGPYGSYVTANNTLTNGTFVLVHSLINPGNETYSGILTFTPSGGAFPTGWYNPINLARLGQSTLYTNQYGHLVVGASAGACLNDPTEPSCRAGSNQVTQAPSRDNDRRDYLLKIILPVVLGFLLIVLIAVILAIRYKRRNRRASEDRVYNPRPAEYGSALVVDDIMQKSRNHTGAELPILDPSSRQAFPPAYLEAYPVPELSKPRGQVRRTPQEAPRDDRRRPSQGRSRPAPRRPAYSDTDSEPQLRGRGNRPPSPNGRDASRSRSRSRSRSPSDRSRSVSRSRSASPSDRRSRSRSVSRSLSRSRSPASGSSRSRSSFSEGPRR